jgi:hypothetical protein
MSHSESHKFQAPPHKIHSSWPLGDDVFIHNEEQAERNGSVG